MTKDDVIRLARQAGLLPEKSNVVYQHLMFETYIQSFAKLVAEYEREACAKVCDDLPAPPHIADSDVSMWDVASMECADAIRARGQA